MRSEVVFAGFGGQGVIKAAILLALAAGLFEEKEVAQTQSYGPEARGGACRSEVIISDERIDYIKAEKIDAFVVMSQPAMDRYIQSMDRNTRIIADTTLVQSIPEKRLKLYPVQATSVSEETFGRPLFANILMLGALSAVTGIVSISSLERALAGNVPAKTIEQNRDALKKGYEIGKAIKVE